MTLLMVLTGLLTVALTVLFRVGVHVRTPDERPLEEGRHRSPGPPVILGGRR